MNTENTYYIHPDETSQRLNWARASRNLGEQQFRAEKYKAHKAHLDTDKRIRHWDGAGKQAMQPRETLLEQISNLFLNTIIAVLNMILAFFVVSARIPYFGREEIIPEGLAPLSAEPGQDFDMGYDDLDASLRHHITPKPEQTVRSSAAAIKNYARHTRAGIDVSPAVLARISAPDMRRLENMSKAELKVLSNARHDDIKAHFTRRKEMGELVEARQLERDHDAKKPIVPAWRKMKDHEDEPVFSLDAYRNDRLSQLALG